MSDQVEEELLLIKPDSRYKKLFHPIIHKQQQYTKQASKDKLGIREKKVILLSDKYIQAKIYIENGNKDEAIKILKEIVYADN